MLKERRSRIARVGGVPEREAAPFGRFAYGLSRRCFGEVVAPLTVMAHHPGFLLSYGAFELASERSNLVDERLMSLAVLKVSTMVGCEFCMVIGSTLSRGEGVTEEQLRELPNFEQSRVFSPLEKRVLGYAAAMTRTPTEVTDDLFGALREHLGEAQLVELTTAIALENYRARFNHAFGMGSQGFSEGSFCIIPEAPTIMRGVE